MHVYEVVDGATDARVDQLTKLFLQQISIDDDDLSYSSVRSAVERTLDPKSSSRLVIAEEDQEIYGFALFNIGVSLRVGGPYLWLNELFVQNDNRNRGIGKKLLLFIIHYAEREGIQSIELETGVNNSATKHIYNSLGFYEVISKRYGFTF